MEVLMKRLKVYAVASIVFFMLFALMEGCTNTSSDTTPTSVQNYEQNGSKETSSKVKGYVYHNGLPVPNTTVKLQFWRNGYQLISSGQTNSRGYYHLTVGYMAGSYRVTSGNDCKNFYHDGSPGKTYTKNLYPGYINGECIE